jgi:dienelactone hydrolase
MGWGILGGEAVEIQSGGVALQTHIGRPAAPGRYPAVIMLHGINGPSAGTRRAAERWGDEGYVGCLVNWQTADKDPTDNEIMRFVADAAD